MSGVSVIRHLLANSAPLTDVVPATRIMAGTLPVGTTRPAISITQISAIEAKTIAMNDAAKNVTERVQVTVEATTYPTQKSIIRLVRSAIPNTRGTVNGVVVDSISPDIEGPDIKDEDIQAFVQSHDFIVRFQR